MTQNKFFAGEQIGFAATITDGNNTPVTTANVVLQLMRCGSTKPLFEFQMTYDSQQQAYAYVWTSTVKGDFELRAVAYDNHVPVVTNENVELTIYP